MPSPVGCHGNPDGKRKNFCKDYGVVKERIKAQGVPGKGTPCSTLFGFSIPCFAFLCGCCGNRKFMQGNFYS